jgi:hypothetical protein
MWQKDCQQIDQVLIQHTLSVLTVLLASQLDYRLGRQTVLPKTVFLRIWSGNRFLIIFIDVGSRIAFIYFMTSMSEINESETIGQEEEQHASFKTQVELADNSHSYQ